MAPYDDWNTLEEEDEDELQDASVSNLEAYDKRHLEQQ